MIGRNDVEISERWIYNFTTRTLPICCRPINLLRVRFRDFAASGLILLVHKKLQALKKIV